MRWILQEEEFRKRCGQNLLDSAILGSCLHIAHLELLDYLGEALYQKILDLENIAIAEKVLHDDYLLPFLTHRTLEALALPSSLIQSSRGVKADQPNLALSYQKVLYERSTAREYLNRIIDYCQQKNISLKKKIFFFSLFFFFFF